MTEWVGPSGLMIIYFHFFIILYLYIILNFSKIYCIWLVE